MITPECGATACNTKMQGTPLQMAPAIIENRSYGLEVDWWAWGTHAAELCSSHPFPGESIKEVFDKIKKGKPRFNPYSRKRRTNLVEFLEPLMTKSTFEDQFSNDEARATLMSQHPADHPILSNEFWFGGPRDRDGVAAYWLDICKTYAADPSLCPSSYDQSQSSVADQPLCRGGDTVNAAYA